MAVVIYLHALLLVVVSYTLLCKPAHAQTTYCCVSRGLGSRRCTEAYECTNGAPCYFASIRYSKTETDITTLNRGSSLFFTGCWALTGPAATGTGDRNVRDYIKMGGTFDQLYGTLTDATAFKTKLTNAIGVTADRLEPDFLRKNADLNDNMLRSLSPVNDKLINNCNFTRLKSKARRTDAGSDLMLVDPAGNEIYNEAHISFCTSTTQGKTPEDPLNCQFYSCSMRTRRATAMLVAMSVNNSFLPQSNTTARRFAAALKQAEIDDAKGI